MTVERHVFLKFSEEFATPEAIDEVVDRTPPMLSPVPQVQRLRIGRPADPRTSETWHLVLIIELSSADEIDDYREHPAHRSYYLDFLKPRLDIIKAWNFEF